MFATKFGKGNVLSIFEQFVTRVYCLSEPNNIVGTANKTQPNLFGLIISFQSGAKLLHNETPMNKDPMRQNTSHPFETTQLQLHYIQAYDCVSQQVFATTRSQQDAWF